MSVYNCHKQQPQPWMSYINPNMITFPGHCCPSLVTTTDRLLPFQVISNGAYVRAEISPYGEDNWSEIALSVTSIYTSGFYIHSYIGSLLSGELSCGAYDFRVIAGETWWFEPFAVEDFEITETAYTIRDLLALPLKFAEQQIEGIPIIAPCDSFLPFMYATDNATSGSVTVYLYDEDCNATELTDIVVDIMTIGGKTYYIHEGGCFSPFLECGLYKLEIVDGENSYFSVWFDVECGIEDIPDGNRALRDFNGCVMRDADGDILYESCIS